MSSKEICGVLDRKVFFVREATEKERELFPDKKEGGFFTFALESGQKFVACFFEEGTGRKEVRKMVFRPLNKMVKGLEEFSWVEPLSFFSFSDTKLDCKFPEGTSEEDKKMFKYLLSPKEYDAFGLVAEVGNIPLLNKAFSVSEAYFYRQKAQERLTKVLIPEIKQNLLNKQKER